MRPQSLNHAYTTDTRLHCATTLKNGMPVVKLPTKYSPSQTNQEQITVEKKKLEFTIFPAPMENQLLYFN